MDSKKVKTSISLDKWVYEQFLENNINKSAVVQEAIIKLFMTSRNSVNVWQTSDPMIMGSIYKQEEAKV